MRLSRPMLLDLVRSESGQDLVEYALVAGIILAVAVASLKGFAAIIATIPNGLMSKFLSAF